MPDRSPERVAELHDQIRAWLIETMPQEAPDAIAAALMYEVVSILASMAATRSQASDLLRHTFRVAAEQLASHGIGRPHP